MLDHIDALRDDGWTLKAIALAAGLNVEAFRRALRKGTTNSHVVAKVLDVR
jgi:lambda repressor-like predicted transcriptional regulator